MIRIYLNIIIIIINAHALTRANKEIINTLKLKKMMKSENFKLINFYFSKRILSLTI
jgi:hypothetical protein